VKRKLERPLAITMWDFSWLERRWPGAGYESWEEALDALRDRGYDAVRIDAYPHLLAAGADRDWELVPPWTTQAWGSPARVTVRVRENLVRFVSLCRERGLLVALSTWFRQDVDDVRLRIASPEQHAAVWKAVLDELSGHGLLDAVLYVDLCNEFSQSFWAPFLAPALGLTGELKRSSPEVTEWMRRSIGALRAAHPGLDYCYSFFDELDGKDQDVSFLDLLEPHVWFTSFSDFYARVPYGFEKFDAAGYDNLVRNGERLYRQDPGHWQAALEHGIATVAAWSRATGKPLVTTECWGVVDYKDWPGLDWGWVKELCALGTLAASATGRWAAIATSNFCGPQFAGMWRDVGWHRRLTDAIHRGALPRQGP
jgi:hypothetical protein